MKQVIAYIKPHKLSEVTLAIPNPDEPEPNRVVFNAKAQ